MADLSKNVILVVDDEPLVVRAATVAIAAAGYRAVVAENGSAGLETFERMQHEICLVLADVLMPYMTGVEMAESIRAMDASVPILLMSGYSDQTVDHHGGKGYRLIRKPFLQADLIRAIQAAIEPPAAKA